MQLLVQLPIEDILGLLKKLANLLTKNLKPIEALEVEGKSLMAKKAEYDEFEEKIKKDPEDQSH